MSIDLHPRLTNGSATLDALPPDEYKIQFGGDAADTADPQLRTLFDKVGFYASVQETNSEQVTTNYNTATESNTNY